VVRLVYVMVGVSIRLRSVGPEKFQTADAVSAELAFQSVSGLWDRRNTLNVPQILEFGVSIRLRSVGPEKCARSGAAACGSSFQSVSGLWDRRNARTATWSSLRSSFNPSPVCGTGEICVRSLCQIHSIVSIRLRSVGPEKSAGRGPAGGRRSFNPSPVCGTGEIGRQLVRAVGDLVSIRLRSVGPEKCC